MQHHQLEFTTGKIQEANIHLGCDEICIFAQYGLQRGRVDNVGRN